MAVQGPKSFKLMEKVLGKKITELKFFGFDYYTFKGNKFLIARSGWSKQGGYEVYVENRKAGQMLYDELFSSGKEFSVEPGCPNLIERIESALLSAGNDFDSGDNPYECGFDKYIDVESDINYLGKKALVKISKEGINKKLMGVLIDMDEIEVTGSMFLYNNNNIVGDLRSGTYSPNLKKVIGIAMIKKEYWDKKTPIELKIGDKKSKGTLCDLPIV
jgi:dimethylsulfoniopropionate demethylase